MHIYDVHLYPALVLMDRFCIYKVTQVRAYKTSLGAICNYHHVNLKYFLHSDNWLLWQQPLPFGLKNFILSCVIASSIERINMITF